MRTKQPTLSESNVLNIYPAIEQLLKRRVKGLEEVKVWRDFSTTIQYEGFTSHIQFEWFYESRKFIIKNIKIEKLTPAPKDEDQYDLEC